MKILVLGSGLVGGPIAQDLAAEPSFAVTVADVDTHALDTLRRRAALSTAQCDVRDRAALARLLAATDMVVSAVPGFLGFETLRQVIEAGKNVVDIAFFPEDPYLLDDLARKRQVTAVVDCGLCPGMSNVLIGHAHAQLDETEEVLIFVGGLPQVRERPYEYKAVFSPIDVIEEYTRPARMKENGRLVIRPALSEPEPMTFSGVGTLEAFNTDGLRTLLRNIPAANMREKTLRYPGHRELMAVLRDTGFFSTEAVELDGHPVRPIDLTASLLFPKWKMAEGEWDLTVMRVTVRGKKEGCARTFQYDLLDRFDTATGTLSMARTTGYTASAAVRMLESGIFSSRGVIAPEFLGGRPECVRFLLDQLAARGVVYKEVQAPSPS